MKNKIKDLLVSFIDIIICLIALFVFTGGVLFVTSNFKYLFLVFIIYAVIELLKCVGDFIDNISVIRA